ncbi:hypothetical protein ACFOLC_06065 [Lysobacter cavernae]|uniref:Uncharacterized protein n=1 Tax=Lysobacter cavernae TaxID=1685901 RepID=A0ABV7RLS2_9GAMM
MIASGVVILVHVALGAILARLLHGAATADAAADPPPTYVEFIPRRSHAGKATSPMPPSPRPPTPRIARDTPLAPTPPTATAADPPPANRSLSAVLIGQARDWAERKARAEALPVDPFERPHRLQGVPAERFHMREPLSVASVVDRIGSVFYAPGSERDPCPRNRQHIAALATGGGEKALQQEIEFERRHCRP